MYLIEDSRNQVGKHKNVEEYCKRKGIVLVRKCLNVGDYMISEDGENPSGNVSVDTKQDIMELCSNVMSNDHRRFRMECTRAMETGIQLIVLIEELPPFGKIELWNVPRWQTSSRYHRFGDPMTRVDPKVFRKALNTMTEKYGVQFRFCTRKQSPERIIKYLKGEFK